MSRVDIGVVSDVRSGSRVGVLVSDVAREWTIGEMAKAARVTVRTLHHYDRLRLLVPSSRSMSGHRRYRVAEVHRLYRILSLRSLGFPLSAISELLDPDAACGRRSSSILVTRASVIVPPVFNALPFPMS